MPEASGLARHKLGALALSLGGLWPGILLAAVIALAAQALAARYGAPAMLLALLLGAAFHHLAAESRTAAGIAFSASALLRVGVALLGLRLSWQDIAGLGWGPAAAVVALVGATILLGAGLAVALRRDVAFGLLAGGSVAICGASAAVALSLVLPPARVAERDVTFVVAGVTTLSTLAMVLYPVLFGWLGYSETEAGFLIGATIHDVAQVIGAGYSYGEQAGETAVFVKLQRVLMLPVALLAIGIALRGRASGPVGIPSFLVVFILLMVVGNVLDLPRFALEAARAASDGLLLTAIAALGVRTSLRAMSAVGPRSASLLGLLTVALILGALAIEPLVLARNA